MKIDEEVPMIIPKMIARPKPRIAEWLAIGTRDKAGRNLYGAFIEQNVNASRILIVESAFDPRNPTRARRAGASEPGQRAGMAILVFGSI